MPYISVNVTGELTDTQKDEIKRGLGDRIAVIPGKSEKALMIDISDRHTIYMAGEKLAHTAYLDVKIYGHTDLEAKRAFTEAAFAVVSQATGIPADGMYLNFSEYDNWGTRGTMK